MTRIGTAPGVSSVSVGGTLTGGTDTRVLFDDNGTIGEDAGFSYNKTTDIATLVGGLNISALTTGSVLFAGPSGAITQDNTNFFWDDTNNVLILGKTTRSNTAALLEIGKTALDANAQILSLIANSGAALGITASGRWYVANEQLHILNSDGSKGGILKARQYQIEANTASEVGGYIRGAGSQTGDLLQFQNSSQTVLTNIDPAGRLRFQTVAAGVTNEGSVWADSTQKALQIYVNAVEQTLNTTIFTQTGDQTVANTTNETNLIDGGVGTTTLPANFFVAGKSLIVKFFGYYSTTSSAGTYRFKLKLGSTVVLDTTAVSASNNQTNQLFKGDCFVSCRTTGATGTVFAQGLVDTNKSGNSSDLLPMTNTAAITIDTTVSQAVTFTVQWGTADAGNTITVTNGFIQVIN